MAIAHVNGIDIHYEVHGVGDGTDPGAEDAPWVLNIGGTGGDLRETFPSLSPLNKEFRVVHYDQRGLGQTAKPETDYTMAEYADDAAALIRHVMGDSGSSRCHVVGMSFGGMVALNLAVRHPELVDRLVLLVTSPGGDHASYRLTDIEDMEPDVALRTRLELMDRRWDPDADEPIPGLGGIYDVIFERMQQPLAPDAAMGLSRQLAARNQHDVVDQLRSIDRPTFVGCGRYDGLAPCANSEVLAELLPNAVLRVFEGGHLMTFQDPSAWPAVLEFLSSEVAVGHSA